MKTGDLVKHKHNYKIDPTFGTILRSWIDVEVDGVITPLFQVSWTGTNRIPSRVSTCFGKNLFIVNAAPKEDKKL